LNGVPEQFVAFDVLHLNGRDWTGSPLAERKRILRSVVPRESGCVTYANHVERDGRGLYRAACEADLEGIVAKWKDGLYTPEATTWVKIKSPSHRQGEGRRELFERRRPAVA